MLCGRHGAALLIENLVLRSRAPTRRSTAPAWGPFCPTGRVPTRVLVCGSRHWTDPAPIRAVLVAPAVWGLSCNRIPTQEPLNIVIAPRRYEPEVMDQVRDLRSNVPDWPLLDLHDTVVPVIPVMVIAPVAIGATNSPFHGTVSSLST